MPPHDLPSFADEVARLAARIDAPPALLPTFGLSEDAARPHIEFDGRRFHFVVVERGQELERISSPDPDEILYRVFETVTSMMASAASATRRPADQDFRRVMFETQLGLLGLLSDAWRERTRARNDDILRRSPYRDE